MKRIILVTLLSIVAFAVHAQALVSGEVKDKSGNGISYATVSILSREGVVTAAASDDKGVFKLNVKKAGTFALEISAVGYQTLYRRVDIASKPVKVENIVLNDGVQVDAVAVTVQKPIVTADAEKLSYSVEDDPEAQSSTLEEIIRKVPQLSIDADGKVVMNGQTSYKILVNGHASAGMANNFSEVIKSMPASTIKKIEVITNPSMKYDAEGMGGVLNIITTKARFDGYNGSVNLSGSSAFNRSWDLRGSATAMFQSKKLSLSAMVFFYDGNAMKDPNSEMETFMQNLSPASLWKTQQTSSETREKFYSVYANLKGSYQVNDKNLLSLEFSYWNGRHKQLTDSFTEYLGEGYQQRFASLQNSVRPWNGMNIVASYQKDFNKDNHSITFSDDIEVNFPENNNQFLNYDGDLMFGYDASSIVDRSKAFSNTFQVDYQNPLTERHWIEAGAKHRYQSSNMDTHTDYYLSEVPLRNEYAYSRLSKHILGAYFGYSYKTKIVTLRGGVRLEGAWYKMNAVENDEKEAYKSSLANLVPYASITLMPKMGHMLSFSYTERLSRPDIEAMDPYIKESGNTRTYGNPDLKSGVSHTLNLKYAVMDNKWMLSAGITSILSANQISRNNFIDEDGFYNATYANNGKYKSIGGDVSFSYRPSTKVNLSGSLRASWSDLRLRDEGIHVFGWSMHQSLNLNFALWKGARMTLSESYMIVDPRENQVFEKGMLFTTARLGQMFLKDKLEVSLTVVNPFSKYISPKITSNLPTYTMETSVRRTMRMLKLALSYRFGKQGLRVKTVNRKDDNTESIGKVGEQGSESGGMF